MGGGWGFGISWMGEDGCWQRQLWPRSGFVYLPASFLDNFESLWMGLGSSWAQIGFRLGLDWAPLLLIDVLGVIFGAPRPDFG